MGWFQCFSFLANAFSPSNSSAPSVPYCWRSLSAVGKFLSSNGSKMLLRPPAWSLHLRSRSQHHAQIFDFLTLEKPSPSLEPVDAGSACDYFPNLGTSLSANSPAACCSAVLAAICSTTSTARLV